MNETTTNYTVVLDPKAYAGITLATEDDRPMDTPWHRDCMMLLIAVTGYHFRRRNDFYVGGNNFIYFNPDQARNLDYRGPDFFYIKDGVDRSRERLYWAVWEEGGQLPDVIIELLSPTTETEDRTTKFAIYEQTLRTPEYFMYDPYSKTLEGFRLVEGHYQMLKPNDRGWLWSEELQLWLGTWEGEYMRTRATWLRFYTADGELVPLEEESERQRAEAEHQRAEAERHQTEAERQRAEAQRQRAEAERQRAEAERQRAENAEAELARLKAFMAQKGTAPGNGEEANS